MNNTTDPIFEALDRLARVADTNSVGDPMPGITRKARANRRRATALAVSGVAAVAAAGVGVASAIDFPGAAEEPGYANSPSNSPTSASSTPTPSPSQPAMAEFDRARADVDGDGAADVIRVRIPEADADEAQQSAIESKDVRLQVELAEGATVELPLGEEYIPWISETADVDGNGTAEVVLTFTGGGDSAWLRVFTWDGATMVQAEPAAGSPADLAGNGVLSIDAYGASAALVDGGLISWVVTDDTSKPFKVRVWTWQLDGSQLIATEEEQIWCKVPEQYPTPC